MEKSPQALTTNVTAPAELSRFKRVVLPSLFLLVAMFNSTLVVVGLKELIIDRLSGTVTDASLFFSIEMIAYVLFAPVWGLLSDRLGVRRNLIVAGFLASGLLYAAFTAVSSVEVLLVLRFLQGAFAVMGWSTLMALVLDQASEAERGRDLGIMGGALILGVSLGVPAGGSVASRYGDLAPLWLAAALFAALAIGSLGLRDSLERRPRPGWRDILSSATRSPGLLLPYLFHFADRYTVGFVVVLLPLYLESLGAAEPALRGRYLATFLLPFALLQVITGRLSDRLGPYVPLFVGSALYGSALCLVGYAGLFELWWVMLALGVLASIMFPPAIALTAAFSEPGARGGAMGGFNLAGSLGFAVGPLAGAWAYERWGYGPAFVLAGIVEIACCVLALALLWCRGVGPKAAPGNVGGEAGAGGVGPA